MKLDRKLLVGLSLLLSTLPLAVVAQANAPTKGSPDAAALGPSDGGPPAPAALEGSTPTLTAQAPSAPPASAPPQAAPTQPAPTQPGPAQQPPADAQAQGAPQKLQETPPGQWVYTQQYGWLWMPYGEAFTQVPQDDQGQPYMYVYGPTLGWSWVVAPWVSGWGPYPYYGLYGPANYWWYGWGPHWHGYYGGWYGGYYGHGYYGRGPYYGHGPYYGGVRPAPPRAGYGAPGHVGGPVHVGGVPHGARPAVGRGGGRR